MLHVCNIKIRNKKIKYLSFSLHLSKIKSFNKAEYLQTMQTLSSNGIEHALASLRSSKSTKNRIHRIRVGKKYGLSFFFPVILTMSTNPVVEHTLASTK